ncbi:MAG: glycosyltransferase family 4 protein [Bacteroidia bacterium]|nr:glycosyltransferase family 4 protein [Bacteroidia bacterium]
MNLLYLHQYYCPAGGWGNNRSADFAQTWASLGHRVVVVTSTAYFPPQHPAHTVQLYRFEENGVQVVAINVAYAQRMGLARRAWSFARFYQKLVHVGRSLPKPDLIYASSTPPTVVAAGRKLARRWSVPYVFEAVDVWPEVPIGLGAIGNPIAIGLFHRWVNRLYGASAAVVALSPGMADLIRAQGVPPEKIWVVPNGTDTTVFTPPAERPAGKPIRLVHTGSLGRVNHLEALLTAAQWLEQQPVPAWELHLVGEGSEKARLQALARDLKLTRVRFLPAVAKSAMPQLLRQAHIGVMTVAPYPVLEHNSANKWYDYLATGLPIVQNYGGWQAKVLQATQTGLWSPLGDTASFQQNLCRLVTDADLRQQLGTNGPALARQHYDRTTLATEVATRLQGLIQR